MRLTDLSIKGLAAPLRGQTTYGDDALAGFGVRVSQGGTKSFVLVYGPRRERLTLGRYPVISLSQAREKARIVLAERTLGHGRPSTILFEEAREAFVEHCGRKNRTRTVKEYTRLLDRHFRFGRTPLREISRLDISKRLDKLSETPAIQNYAFRVAWHFFRFCVQRGHLIVSPCAGMTSPAKLRSRMRVLSDHELRAIWHACEDANSIENATEASERLPMQFAAIVKLLILTGQRRGEIGALENAFFKEELCTLPPELTKNGREHTFPLTPLALSTLQPFHPTADSLSRFLFPARGKPAGCFNGWSKAKTQLDKLSGVSGWTLHDLRRTFATRLAEAGVAPHVIERLLNHVSGTISGVAAIYNRHGYIQEMRAAMALWEQKLLNLVNARNASA